MSVIQQINQNKTDITDSPMDFLNKQLNENIETENIDLEFQQIESLSEIISLLCQFPNLKILNLHGNRIQSLTDLSPISQLQILDLSNNLMTVISPQEIQYLKQLTNLQILNIDLNDNQEVKLNIISQLPSLQILNGDYIQKEDQQQPSPQQNQPQQLNQQLNQEVQLQQQDLEKSGLIFDQVKSLIFSKTKDDQLDQQMHEEFGNHIKDILGRLNERLQSTQAENQINFEIIQSKIDLYEICFEKFINYLALTDPKAKESLLNIKITYDSLFEDLKNQVTLNMNKNNANANEVNAIKKGTDMKDHLKQTEQILSAAEQLEKQNQQLLQDKEEMYMEIDQLREENQQYLDMIIRYSKGDTKAISHLDNKTHQQTQQSANFNSRKQPMQMSSGNKEQQQFMKLMGSTANIGQTQQRSLSMKQLKDIIEEIYASKVKFDQKQFENKLPRETMEQHMYAYLNQKYGLKSLIIEWATAIINGISLYAKEDNDVAVFGKMLRNECDEEFRFVQQQVKNTIKELLKMYLRGKHPYKHDHDIANMITQKAKTFLNEDECQDIIKYMYNSEDSQVILEKVQAQLKTLTQNIDIKKLPREEQMALLKVERESQKQIKYSLFEKVILDFQLKSHHLFLKNFLSIFRQIDTDQNGIIDEEEFLQLLNGLQLETHSRKFLEKIDPYNNKIISFSQCITLFSSEVVTIDGEQLSILQKISQMEV